MLEALRCEQVQRRRLAARGVLKVAALAPPLRGRGLDRKRVRLGLRLGEHLDEALALQELVGTRARPVALFRHAAAAPAAAAVAAVAAAAAAVENEQPLARARGGDVQRLELTLECRVAHRVKRERPRAHGAFRRGAVRGPRVHAGVPPRRRGEWRIRRGGRACGGRRPGSSRQLLLLVVVQAHQRVGERAVQLQRLELRGAVAPRALRDAVEEGGQRAPHLARGRVGEEAPQQRVVEFEPLALGGSHDDARA